MSNGLVNIDDFVNHLKTNNLIIVSRELLEQNTYSIKMQRRADLLKKQWLTISEVLELDLLPVKSKSSLIKWKDNGIIKETEWNKQKNGLIKISIRFLNRYGVI